MERASRGGAVFYVAGDEEYLSALKEKVYEEVQEFIENPCAEEVGDRL